MRAIAVLVVLALACGSDKGSGSDGGPGGSGGSAGAAGAPGGGAAGGAAGGEAGGVAGGMAGGTAGGAAGGSAGGAAGEGGAPAPDGGSAGAEPEALPSCRPTCSAPADCATPQVRAYDEDNWRCTDRACEYAGCNSTDECRDLGAQYTCRAIDASSSFRTCLPGCASNGECGTDDGAYQDANFTCEDGVCRWDGCRTDDECTRSLDRAGTGQRWLCRATTAGGSFRACYQACARPADCVTAAQPIVDEDNWACEDGACRYRGCLGDAECRATFMSQAYVCR